MAGAWREHGGRMAGEWREKIRPWHPESPSCCSVPCYGAPGTFRDAAVFHPHLGLRLTRQDPQGERETAVPEKRSKTWPTWDGSCRVPCVRDMSQANSRGSEAGEDSERPL